MAIVEIRNLVRRRVQNGSAFELRVPELIFDAGRFYGIAGPSGSGKSTLLDVLALVLRPTSAQKFQITARAQDTTWDIGSLWRDEREHVLADLRKRAFGYVLQSGGLIGFLTVRQNLAIPYRLQGQLPDPRRIADLAERFGIERELDKKPRYLSTGQRQRAAILRALLLRPPLILADEPTAALDQVRGAQIAAEFRALALEGGSTIVMVSHDWKLLSSVSDAMITLSAAVEPDGTAVSTVQWDGVWSGFKVY